MIFDNIITRLEYITGRTPEGLKSRIPFRTYWSQFVNKQVKKDVKSRIGLKRILKSEYPFNDIPLINWQHIALPFDILEKLRYSTNDCVGKEDIVCATKEAARQIKEEHENNDN